MMDNPETDAGLPDPRPAVVELVVADMAATLAFYRRLGLDVPVGAEQAPHVEADLGGLRIAWDTEDVIRSFDPGWTRPTGGHSMAIAFRCEHAEAVDRTYAALTAAGYDGHLPPWDAVWGMRYAVVHDPDGRPVDLFAPLVPGNVSAS
jgi:catechol 2,3-dioxygenase-like lactoylglutathione lyase family enzyme